MPKPKHIDAQRVRDAADAAQAQQPLSEPFREMLWSLGMFGYFTEAEQAERFKRNES